MPYSVLCTLSSEALSNRVHKIRLLFCGIMEYMYGPSLYQYTYMDHHCINIHVWTITVSIYMYGPSLYQYTCMDHHCINIHVWTITASIYMYGPSLYQYTCMDHQCINIVHVWTITVSMCLAIRMVMWR